MRSTLALRAAACGALPWLAAVALAACGGAGRAPGPATSPGASISPAAGVPADVVTGARPVGRGARFRPRVRGPAIAPCRPTLPPRFGVHVEVFAADRVVVIPAGIGGRPPLQRSGGRIVAAGCFGALATVEPTGVVLVRPGTGRRLADLFRS